jgi:hypothetical protein
VSVAGQDEDVVPAWRRHGGAAGPDESELLLARTQLTGPRDGEAPRRPTTIAITSAMSSAVTSTSL